MYENERVGKRRRKVLEEKKVFPETERIVLPIYRKNTDIQKKRQ